MIKSAAVRPLELLQRIASSSTDVPSDLGLLSSFEGTWRGTGFDLIARPDKQNNQIFFLMLNATIETLEFTPIGGAVPNRGSEQGDISLHGLKYSQDVKDAATREPLHFEPGFWMHVPPTSAPDQGETYVRQSAIPHGNSLIAQSLFFQRSSGGPSLEPVDSFPFAIEEGVAIPRLTQVPNPPLKAPLGYLDPYLNPELPAGLSTGLEAAAIVRNPVLLLEAAIRGQEIKETVVIEVSSAQKGGIVNIPFVVKNANTVQLDSIFWIETVSTGDEESFQQLQYVQRVILDFHGIHWPHISVATLVKQ
jgi:hypothetical protein